MFSKILIGDTQKNISIIGELEFLKHFYLAGGTACALHIGHRLSYDLDFFSQTKFDLLLISRILENTGDFIIDYSDKDTLIGKFNNTRVSFMYYKYRLLNDFGRLFSINIASLEDIGSMKIEAIASRGKKRDFVDLYFILNELKMELAEFFELYKKKYANEKYNEPHILKSLTYFADADNDPNLNMLIDTKWEQVKKFFREQKAILDYAVTHGIKFKNPL
ncbi:MAG: nucleotidyl transferase AbiEii/AbiGii toxin family protein [Acidobacteria bacterium]|nr:nucleotidyl transferase AbiEii/AbiGii toxin family protein [Acidobacteriota bacterium]